MYSVYLNLQDLPDSSLLFYLNISYFLCGIFEYVLRRHFSEVLKLIIFFFVIWNWIPFVLIYKKQFFYIGNSGLNSFLLHLVDALLLSSSIHWCLWEICFQIMTDNVAFSPLWLFFCLFLIFCSFTIWRINVNLFKVFFCCLSFGNCCL